MTRDDASPGDRPVRPGTIGAAPDDPVAAYRRVYGLADEDLYAPDVLHVDGEFAGEADFVARANRDYEVDRHGGFRIVPGETVVVVVDMQEDFVRPDSVMCQPGAHRQLGAVRSLLDVARAHGSFVVFTAATYPRRRVNDTPLYCAPVANGSLAVGSPGTVIAPELGARPGEPVIATKHTYDAFFGTELDSLLRGAGIRTVVICGTMTNYCCEATARGAFDRGYHVVFGSDVTSTDSAVNHVATLRTMRRGYARVMSGREIEAALAGDDSLYERAVGERRTR